VGVDHAFCAGHLDILVLGRDVFSVRQVKREKSEPHGGPRDS
jgi:hypothetical protein